MHQLNTTVYNTNALLDDLQPIITKLNCYNFYKTVKAASICNITVHMVNLNITLKVYTIPDGV